MSPAWNCRQQLITTWRQSFWYLWLCLVGEFHGPEMVLNFNSTLVLTPKRENPSNLTDLLQSYSSNKVERASWSGLTVVKWGAYLLRSIKSERFKCWYAFPNRLFLNRDDAQSFPDTWSTQEPNHVPPPKYCQSVKNLLDYSLQMLLRGSQQVFWLVSRCHHIKSDNIIHWLFFTASRTVTRLELFILLHNQKQWARVPK